MSKKSSGVEISRVALRPLGAAAAARRSRTPLPRGAIDRVGGKIGPLKKHPLPSSGKGGFYPLPPGSHAAQQQRRKNDINRYFNPLTP